MKKALTLLAVLLLAAVAVAGCGKAPAGETVDKAIQKSQDVKSEHMEFSVDLVINGNPALLPSQFQGLLPLTLTVNGGADSDSSDPASPKAKGNISITGIDKILNGLAQSPGVDPQTQTRLSLIAGALANLEFVMVDKKMYLKIAGTWYDLGDFSPTGDFSALGGVSRLTPGTTGANAQCYTDAMKDPAKFGSDKLLTNLQEAGSENIDGTSTRHFTADVNMDQLLTALADIARGCGDAQNAADIEASRNETTSFFRSFKIELWIDSDDNFRQIKLAIDGNPQALSGTMPNLGGTSGAGAAFAGIEGISLNMTSKFSQFGATFDIAKPEGNIMKIEDVLGGMGALGGMGGATTTGLGGAT